MVNDDVISTARSSYGDWMLVIISISTETPHSIYFRIVWCETMFYFMTRTPWSINKTLSFEKNARGISCVKGSLQKKTRRFYMCRVIKPMHIGFPALNTTQMFSSVHSTVILNSSHRWLPYNKTVDSTFSSIFMLSMFVFHLSFFHQFEEPNGFPMPIQSPSHSLYSMKCNGIYSFCWNPCR